MTADPEHSNGLDPTSYTAHRLHHATQRHLHLTSRRVFIGPIPVGWLKTHRADWLKNRLHYSRREMSFTAEPGTNQQRRTTGPQGCDRNSGIVRSADGAVDSTDSGDGEGRQGEHGNYQEAMRWIREEEEEGEEDEEDYEQAQMNSEGENRNIPASRSDPIPIPSSYSSTPTIMPSAKWKGKQREEPSSLPSKTSEEPTPRPNHSPISPRPRPKTSDTTNTSVATAPTRPPTAESVFRPAFISRGESFATAHESWESPDEHQAKYTLRRRIGRPFNLTPIPPMPVITPVHPISTYTTVAFDEPVHMRPHEAGASLLLRDRPHRNDSMAAQNIDEQNNRKGFFSLRRTPTQPSASLLPNQSQKSFWASINRDRISGGLVHFNTKVDVYERDKQMQQKLTDLSRARSLRVGRRTSSGLRKLEGEIIKMDNMIVRVEMATTHWLPDDYDENESSKIDTRTVDKWREYLMVCRENSDDLVPMTLRMYKSRTIPAIDRTRVSGKSTRLIPLNPKTTRVNLYSSLDKTLVIWCPYRRGTLIYIVRPRCTSASVEWYTFLRNVLGEKSCTSLNISVPDLTLTIRISNPFEKEKPKLNVDSNKKSDAPAIEETTIVSHLLKKSMQMLDGVTEWEDTIKHWKKNERMGLAWRRYDRLEWIHGVNRQRMHGTIAMQKTHELELRPKIHYPTESLIENGEKMTEPSPVEGFLIRLTSAKGRQERRGRFFQKRLYFMMHDQFLCFCRPSRASPPVLPTPLDRGVAQCTPVEMAKGMPLIYSVTPYLLNQQGDIEWLAKGTAMVIDQKDHEAYNEAERKVNAILRSEGFVDLTKAKEVRPVQPEGSPVQNCTDSGIVDDHSEATPNSDVEYDFSKSFEILLENGLILRLQSYNIQTRDEWVSRLAALIKYWKARDREDLAIVRRTRDMNLRQINMDEEMESIMGQFGRKWEVSRSIASAELYNVCGISSCRTIAMSGVLYRKPRRHATFRRYNVILCNGELLIFQNAHRARTGKEIPTVYQELHLSLLLRDCYVYSGLITGSDLLYQNQTFDSNTPGRHALPRIYPDGYTSQDEDTMTCFVLWYGSKSSVVCKRDEDRNIVGRRRTVSALGNTGRAIVFKARSRLERDNWVVSINTEIERLNEGVSEDIKIEPPK